MIGADGGSWGVVLILWGAVLGVFLVFDLIFRWLDRRSQR